MTNDTFLSCDWGTSNFRLRLIRSNDLEVLGEMSNGDGIAVVFGQWKNEAMGTGDRTRFYTDRLIHHVSRLEKQLGRSLEGIPLLISGMASSSIGLKELAYKALPFDIGKDRLIMERISPGNLPGTEILLISGICTNNDVIRGEETLLVGAYKEQKSRSAIYIFPGTHSKHVWVEYGMVTGFSTFMTGEVFRLLSQESILADSIKRNELIDAGNFQQGVKEGVTSNLLNSIFSVRTNQVFNRNSPLQNYHYLSGLLIGYELSGLQQHESNEVILVCGESLKEQYLMAMEIIGMPNVQYVNADIALVRGHREISKGREK